MQHGDNSFLTYQFTPNPSHCSSAFQLNPLQYSHPSYSFPLVQELKSNNSATSEEAEEKEQNTIINERKQRRMISNRESARRSRMRKQKHLDELWSQVVWLRNENHQLNCELNHVSERRDQVLQENSQLKAEASELRQVICDMQLESQFSCLRDLDSISCNTAYHRAESPFQSLSSSMDLLR